MGHVNTKMLHEAYSKWIKGADKGVQRAALKAQWVAFQRRKIGVKKAELA
jgi:hypothetical protein